jgi:hypothetical protein
MPHLLSSNERRDRSRISISRVGDNQSSYLTLLGTRQQGPKTHLSLPRDNSWCDGPNRACPSVAQRALAPTNPLRYVTYVRYGRRMRL